MKLAFSTHFPKDKDTLSNTPTHFVEKIWQSLLTDNVESGLLEFSKKLKEALPIIGKMQVGDFHPKRHTLRRDEKNNWKAGDKIHTVIHNRTPKRFQFAPTIKCIAIQKAEIIWHDQDNVKLDNPGIFIEDRKLTEIEELQLVKNDGFKSTSDFFQYFNEDWTGKIIHWTNLKY
jgi:hypothetical protein